MRENGMNMERVKVSNRASLLSLLYRYGAMARIDMSRELHVTQAAVTLLCTELLTEGVLVEKGVVSEDGKSGRKKVLLDINYDHRYIIGIYMTYECVFLSVCNLHGELLKGEKINYVLVEYRQNPDKFLSELFRRSMVLSRALGVEKTQILGIGVGITGLVDYAAGISIRAFGLWTKEVNVRDILEKMSGLPVVVDNNIRTVANAEILYGEGKTRDNLILVRWAAGVGAAAVIDSEVYHGRKNSAAEIGHMVMDPDGDRCTCGRQGCLETLISAHVMVNRLSGMCSETATPDLYARWQKIKESGEQLENQDLVPELIMAADEPVVKYRDYCIGVFTRAVLNTVTLFAPNRLVLCGKLLSIPEIFESVKEKFENTDHGFSGTKIILSSMDDRIDYIGPASLIVNRYIHSGAADGRDS